MHRRNILNVTQKINGHFYITQFKSQILVILLIQKKGFYIYILYELKSDI